MKEPTNEPMKEIMNEETTEERKERMSEPTSEPQKAVSLEEQALLLAPIDSTDTDTPVSTPTMEPTAKKFFFGVIGFFILALFTLVMAYQSGVFGKQTNMNYTFLDKSVILPFEIEQWSKDAIQNQGVFMKETPTDTYVLISAGARHTTGYQIAIHSIETKEKEVHLEYEILSPKDEEVMNGESEAYAYAWVLFPKTGLTVTSTELTAVSEK